MQVFFQNLIYKAAYYSFFGECTLGIYAMVQSLLSFECHPSVWVLSVTLVYKKVIYVDKHFSAPQIQRRTQEFQRFGNDLILWHIFQIMFI